MTEEEMAQNSQLWAEENNVAQKKQTKSTQMRTAGVSQAGITSDIDQFEEPTADEGAPEPGEPGGGQQGGGTPRSTPGGGTL